MKGKILRNFSGILIVAALLITGCGKKDETTTDKTGKETAPTTTTQQDKTKQDTSTRTTSGENKKTTEAEADIQPLGDTKVEGKIEFEKTDAGMKIEIELSGLTPGKHGMHLHEFGDCSAPDGKSAGEHFNPGKKQHGDMSSTERHEGDLGNVTADKDGKVKITITDKVMTFDGPNSILGKSVVVHEKEDDLKTQPSGNSGNRIACGVIKED